MAIRQEQELSAYHRAIWVKAVSAQQLGNFSYTIYLMRRLLKSDPEFLMGRQLLRKAEIALIRLRSPSFQRVYRFLFSFVKAWTLREKKPFAALEEIEEILESDPYHRQANWLLHRIALTCHMPETAAFALETLLEGHPKDLPGMHRLAEHYMEQKAPYKAVEIYDQILRVMPSDPVAARRSKDAAAHASMQSAGWNQEGVTYRELIKQTNKSP